MILTFLEHLYVYEDQEICFIPRANLQEMCVKSHTLPEEMPRILWESGLSYTVTPHGLYISFVSDSFIWKDYITNPWCLFP